MSRDLIFDERSKLEGKPGCHALVVGVDSYPHLEGGSGPRAAETFGMTQLSSAVNSATGLCDWLFERRDTLRAPLATCRLLLSSPKVTSFRGSPAGRATTENLLSAATEWRRDASANSDGIALFYFAGHGFELSPTEQAMLAEDFGGDGPLLRGAVTTNNLFYGMAPSTRLPEMAQTQVFFIDTGRPRQLLLPAFARSNTTAVFDADPSAVDRRSAGIFYASAGGANAFAVTGNRTLFNMALIDCLNGHAAEILSDDEEPVWGVTLFSLAKALPLRVDAIARSWGAEQQVSVGGALGSAVLTHLAGPPEVEVVLQIEPEAAAAHARVRIFGTDEQPRIQLDGPVPNPQILKLPAGTYRVDVQFPSGAEYQAQSRLKVARPPGVQWKVRVV